MTRPDPGNAGSLPTGDPRSVRNDRIALALVSCSVLLIEIAITRVLSVVVWYHFAFLAISLAMLGLGAPGVWFALRPPHARTLPVALLLGGATIPLGLASLLRFGRPLPAGGRLFAGAASLLHGQLLLVIASVLIPMLCLGSAVCIFLLRARGREIGRIYGADLAGAAAGAILLVPLLTWFPTPLVVAAAGLLPLGAALLTSPGARWQAAALGALLLAAIAWGSPFTVRYTKEYVEPAGKLFERWTPTGRVTVFSGVFFQSHPEIAFGWGLGDRYRPRPVPQLWVEQDGCAGTPITKLEGNLASLDHLRYDVTGVAYQLAPPRRVCIIGAGGGRDILTALQAGATDIDAVELNPAIVAAVSGPFRDFSGDVYHLPGVHAVIGEGRSFLNRSGGGYDLIQISLIDSWAATAAGAFALSENYLYTVEALRLYWRRTSAGGAVCISRYASGERTFELLRLARLARRALEMEGVPPERHLAIIAAGNVATLMLVRPPLDAAFETRLAAVCLERGFVPLWPAVGGGAEGSWPARIVRDNARPDAELGIDLSPPTDDRPFFFLDLPVLGRSAPSQAARLSESENSALLLRSLLLWMALLALVLFFAPFLLFRRAGRQAGFWRGSAYFFCIGVGFMLVETPWIQRFILYLGHPSYAATVVLATLLLAAGLGSMTAARTDLGLIRRWGLALPALLALVNVVLGPVAGAILGAPLGLRILAGVLLLAPAGFLMGFAFPTGMARFGDPDKAWFWAMNGIASVTASVFALALAITLGLFLTPLLGVGAYLAAWLFLGPDRAS